MGYINAFLYKYLIFPKARAQTEKSVTLVCIFWPCAADAGWLQWNCVCYLSWGTWFLISSFVSSKYHEACQLQNLLAPVGRHWASICLLQLHSEVFSVAQLLDCSTALSNLPSQIQIQIQMPSPSPTYLAFILTWLYLLAGCYVNTHVNEFPVEDDEDNIRATAAVAVAVAVGCRQHISKTHRESEREREKISLNEHWAWFMQPIVAPPSPHSLLHS